MAPLTNSEANTQEAIWASDRPPRVPVARMIARGPLAANRKPIRPLTACVAERSRQKLGAGAVAEAEDSAGMRLGGSGPAGAPSFVAGSDTRQGNYGCLLATR